MLKQAYYKNSLYGHNKFYNAEGDTATQSTWDKILAEGNDVLNTWAKSDSASKPTPTTPPTTVKTKELTILGMNVLTFSLVAGVVLIAGIITIVIIATKTK